jgi:hypothetical protein
MSMGLGDAGHVCQRWRYLVLESPIRLNLQLICTEKRPVRKLLHFWPAVPLAIIFYHDHSRDKLGSPFDNLIAALERCDRVRQIRIINTVGHLWEKIATAMQGPFPALRSIVFDSICGRFTLPVAFLNGSVPCLQHLTLRAIAFPSLPQLLLSTSDLTTLRLLRIPTPGYISGYISPPTIASLMSALPKLKTFSIEFEFPPPRLKRRIQPPPTRFVLPALTELEFQGGSEYLEVLATWVDAPLLDRFKITFHPELVFNIPQTIRLFGHLKCFRPSSLALKFNPGYDASILFSSNTTPHSMDSWNFM